MKKAYNSIILSEGVGVHYLSEYGWAEFMSNLREGQTGIINIWGSGQHGLRLYIDPTLIAVKYIVHGEYLSPRTNWAEMPDTQVADWLSKVDIKTTTVKDGGLIIDEDNVDDILDVVASMKHDFVKEVVESL